MRRTKKKAKKTRVGDIFEIGTTSGLAYVQFTHDGGEMGQLVRVLPGLFSARPTEFVQLAKQRELYFVFYTLEHALRGNQVEIVSHQEVPQWARPYPLMRWPGARDASGKPTAWKIFDASSSLSVKEHQSTPLLHRLTPDQEKLSVHQLWPHPVMVRQLARGWTPERAEDLRLQDVAEVAERVKLEGLTSEFSAKGMRHYLYFPRKADAENAGEWLLAHGFSIEIRMGADGENWLTLATKFPPETGEQMDELRDDMESLATRFSGEYDGWEAEIDSMDSAEVERARKVN